MTDEKRTNNMDNRFYKLISMFDESAIKEVTPKWVVDDMLDLLPDEVWCRDTRFLDIYSKSGVFLYCIMEHLMTKAYDLIEEFPDEVDRKAYIVENQLFGLSWTNIKFADTTRAVVNRKASRTHHMAFIEGDYKVYLKGNGKLLNDELQRIKTEEFDNNMKFDVVVGNPPYNNDIYLDFVQLGYKLSSKYTCMITPAKWQAKGGDKNEQFRKDIVPYMSKIVYYPYCVDVFDIWETSGVCYYLIDRNKQVDECLIKNICKPQPLFNSTRSRKLNKDFTIINICNDIIQKIDLSNLYIDNKYCDSEARWQIWLNNQASGGLLFSLDKKRLNILEPIQGVDNENENTKYKLTSVSKLMFSSNIKDEALSFASWINSKSVRFLIMARASVMTGILNDYCWRFVPDPGAFDKIYEDKPLSGYTPDKNGEYIDSNGKPHCSLYVKYNLNQEEINIIESIIKERK